MKLHPRVSLYQRELCIKYGHGWEYEDKLIDISDVQYDKMFPLSKVIMGARMFPYTVNDNGERVYFECDNKPVVNKKNIYLLLGPSGSGKSTLAEHLKEIGIPEVKSHTTRSIRPGEVPADQGGTYHFVTEEEFKKIEMIEETNYNGNLYGTSKQEADLWVNSSSKCFAIVDAHGVEQFRAIYGDLCKVIYIYLPLLELIERMKARGDSREDISKRVVHALLTGEMENFDIADYVIVNRDLAESKRQLRFAVGLSQIDDW